MLHSLYIWLSFILFYCVPNGSLLPPSNLLRSIFILMKGCIAQLYVSHPVITICHIHHTSSGVYMTPFIFKLNLRLWKSVTCVMRGRTESPHSVKRPLKSKAAMQTLSIWYIPVRLYSPSPTQSTIFSFHVAFG